MTEISLNEEEINYWINKLEGLREAHGGSIELELDDESELLINYDSDEVAEVEYEEVDEDEDMGDEE
ncbi:MAG: hypothetical protein Q8Q04_02450 [archaeon]|nr:hypothetical protein [archaeon]